jgi:hypothetical protein
VTKPPSDGAVHFTRTVPGAVTDTVGIPGAPGTAGLIDTDLATDAVLPAMLFAVTKNVYDVPASKPAKSHVSPVVLAHRPVGVTAGSEVTE